MNFSSLTIHGCCFSSFIPVSSSVWFWYLACGVVNNINLWNSSVLLHVSCLPVKEHNREVVLLCFFKFIYVLRTMMIVGHLSLLVLSSLRIWLLRDVLGGVKRTVRIYVASSTSSLEDSIKHYKEKMWIALCVVVSVVGHLSGLARWCAVWQCLGKCIIVTLFFEFWIWNQVPSLISTKNYSLLCEFVVKYYYILF
jgi:hypothetical protein